MIASAWELLNTGSTAVSSAVSTTNGASALETKDTAAAGEKKKRRVDSKGLSGRQEEGIMETKMEQEEKWGTAGVDVWRRKSSTLNSRTTDESQTDRQRRGQCGQAVSSLLCLGLMQLPVWSDSLQQHTACSHVNTRPCWLPDPLWSPAENTGYLYEVCMFQMCRLWFQHGCWSLQADYWFQ